MAKKKVYAVRQGKKTGLFYTWDACKAAVNGFSGAVYKSFLTEEEARAYLAGGAMCTKSEDAAGIAQKEAADIVQKNAANIVQKEAAGIAQKDVAGAVVENKIDMNQSEISDTLSEKQVIAYVDGSFEVSLGRYAYGCVILTPEGEIIRESGGGNEPEAAALRNVTGEMLGAMHAVKWSMEHGYDAVDIRYDYMGIEMWATGGWKAKNPLTQQYAEYMKKCAGKIRITFQKIAAHTGDKYNEEADKLAKAALE